jgi:hypothetical protein
MRIALYYSGMIRTFKKCYPTVFELLKNHEIDVFMSIWNVPGTSLKHSKDKINKFPELEYEKIDISLIKKECPEFNFRIIDIQDFEESKKIMDMYQKKLTFNKVVPQREIISQYYKIERTNELRKLYQKTQKEKNKEVNYDWFIRLRPDCDFDKLPDLTLKTPILYFNKYIWECPNYLSFNKNQDTNENFWMTNSDLLMDKMCKLFSNISKTWYGNTYGENVAGRYVIHSGLIKYTKTFDFGVRILRSHGNYQIMGVKRNWK